MFRKAKLNVQTLEDRRVLSTVVAFDDAADTLTITGNSAADHVKVIEDDFSNKLHVQHDGIDEVFTSSGIKQVVVDLKGGNDSFTTTLAESTNLMFTKQFTVQMGNGRDNVLLDFAGNANHWATLKEDVSINLSAGSGADKVQINLPNVEIANKLTLYAELEAGADQFDAISYGSIGAQAGVYLSVLGGAGADRMSYYGTYDPQSPATGIKVNSQAVLSVYFDGGAGADRLDATFNGDADGVASFYLHGDQGDAGPGQRDRLSIHTSTKPGGTGTLNLYALAGKGNDTIEVFAEGPLPMNTVSYVDGGLGKDTCVSTFNVNVVNCEAV